MDCMNLRISEVRSVLNPLPRLSSREHDPDASGTAAGGVLETGALVARRNEGAAPCHRLSSSVTASLMMRASIGAGDKKAGVETPDPRKRSYPACSTRSFRPDYLGIPARLLLLPSPVTEIYARTRLSRELLRPDFR